MLEELNVRKEQMNTQQKLMFSLFWSYWYLFLQIYWTENTETSKVYRICPKVSVFVLMKLNI